MDEKIICPVCGTENEPQRLFCKNCNTPLDIGAESRQNTANNGTRYNGEFNSADEIYGSYFCPDGSYASSEEVGEIVGKKREKFLSKFTRMEVTSSKFSWNWPVFILTFIFGLTGTGFYFLYRKMTKLGAIFLAVGILFSFALSYSNGTLQDASSQLNEIYSAFSSGKTDAENELTPEEDENGDIVLPPLTPFGDEEASVSKSELIADFAETVGSFALSLIFALFTNYLYKKHCLDCIMKIHSVSDNPVAVRTLKNQFCSVSGGAVGIAIAVYFVATIILESLLSVVITVL